MLETLKFGGGNWANKTDSTLAYSDQYGNYKPLPFDFTRASSATVVNKEGLIETVQSGIPRIDFLGNTNGALLLEPQRTNLLLQSNQFDTTWSTSNVNLTSGQGGIGGSSNAWLYTITDPTHHLSQNVSSATTNVFSIYAKANSADGIVLRLVGAPNNPYIFYSLLDGTYVGNGGGGGINPSSQPVVNMGNGWYRFQISATGLTQVYIYGGTSLGTFAPNGSIYIQNSQLEVGSYATSIIPTQGSTVTRVAEVCGGAGNDQVINSTEGVLYWEGKTPYDNTASRRISLSDGSISNRVSLEFDEQIENKLKVFITSNGASEVLEYTAPNLSIYNKIAIKWKANDFAIWFNGSEVVIVTIEPRVPVGLTELSFDGGNNANNFFGKTKDLRVYDTALTDGELATLTTL